MKAKKIVDQKYRQLKDKFGDSVPEVVEQLLCAALETPSESLKREFLLKLGRFIAQSYSNDSVNNVTAGLLLADHYDHHGQVNLAQSEFELACQRIEAANFSDKVYLLLYGWLFFMLCQSKNFKNWHDIMNSLDAIAPPLEALVLELRNCEQERFTRTGLALSRWVELAIKACEKHNFPKFLSLVKIHLRKKQYQDDYLLGWFPEIALSLLGLFAHISRKQTSLLDRGSYESVIATLKVKVARPKKDQRTTRWEVVFPDWARVLLLTVAKKV